MNTNVFMELMVFTYTRQKIIKISQMYIIKKTQLNKDNWNRGDWARFLL